LSQLVFERPREEKLLIPRRDFLAFRDRGLDLLLDLIEILVAVGQDLHDRAAKSLVVCLLDEVHVLFQLALDDAREIQDPVRGGLHFFRPASSSSVKGWRTSCSKTAGGTVATSAPIKAASRTCTGLRSCETRVWVWKP